MKVTAIVILVFASMAAGCVMNRSGGASFNDCEWREGITKRLDVVGVWGNPDAVEGDVWIWRENRRLGGKAKAAYYGIGFTVSRLNVATYEHRLRFNDSGVLVNRQTHCLTRAGESWSINPFE